MPLAAGARLGPYEILGLVGSGGMGAVYRARDPRLGRDVAVKVIATDGPASAERLRRFEDEARAVASLSHPNVLTVFDVGERDGEPYVVFELLEGETLKERLRGGPLPVRQAVETAVQVCRGLQAAHARRILHRDLKPDNLFLTAEGFVKILDFGLAKLTRGEGAEANAERTQTAPGVVMGTVGYLSPEQARGLEADARSDIFALGAILYEALSGRRAFSGATAADTISAILHGEPPPVQAGSGPVPGAVERIVRRCLAKEREDRFHSAHDLGLALEAVLHAPGGAASREEVEDRPYPGLASFTEKDAALFFGREDEVAALWGRIRSRSLLAVIGPSGAGKTSFVRAGVVASRPEGWAAIACTPGAAPFRGLGQALVPELAGDVEALRRMLSVDDPAVAFDLVSRWRRGHGAALLVVDQLEELFTLNAAEAQERFATLLGRLSSEADVHVLLSLRDDFLMRCADFTPLAGVFESLSPLRPLSRENLERALVEPAKARGYRFEDEGLVGEMVESLEGTRLALPLLAFAVSRLWGRRDRERKLLTRAGYEETGGVGGALAQHAEATLDRIGPERQGMAREIFRTLVTSQGTRAAADREEVVSLFSDREAAEEVLGQLIDARLLASYEVEGAEGQPGRHRVEIVHESLLRAWPRLVRWRAQDEEGAVLRDQLKQAAHLWEEKGRTGDLLWTGTALQEFELWRGRYQGALTTLEEDFARAMRDKARRRKRLVTAALAAVVVTLAGVAVAIGLSREQATRARDAAKAEALRAESAKLLALAQVRLADDPTEALAFTTASLELADTREARAFAMRALWEAPPALEMPTGAPFLANPAFSLDGERLALGGFSDVVAVWKDDGSPEARLAGHEQEIAGPYATWTSTGLLVTQINGPTGRRARVWSFPGGRLVRTIEHAPGFCWAMGEQLVCNVEDSPSRPGGTGRRLRSWRLPDGEPVELGRLDPKVIGAADFTWTARGWVYARGRQLFLRPPPGSPQTGDLCFGRHDADVAAVGWWLPGVDWVFSFDKAGQYRVWVPSGDGFAQSRAFRRPDSAPPDVALDMTLRWLSVPLTERARARLWDLAALPGARPLSLRRSGSWYAAALAVHPRGDWLAAARMSDARVDFWPLRKTYPAVVDGCNAVRRALAFTPDGRWLATICGPSVAKAIHLWPLPGRGPDAIRKLEFPQEVPLLNLSIEGRGRYVFGAGWNRAAIAPLDGSAPRVLPLSESTLHYGAAVSPRGRHVATAYSFGSGEKTLQVWDVETGAVKSFALPAELAGGEPGLDRSVIGAVFADESTLYTAGVGGLRRWNIEEGTSTVVAATPGRQMAMAAAPGGRRAVTQLQALVPVPAQRCAPIELRDLDSGKARPLPAFGDCVEGFAISADGEVVATGSVDGTVRVGRLSAEPHLLLGHDRAVTNVAISPDLRWVATAGEDDTLRLWPMPDLSRPPLHTLPREELVAKLRSLTNLRAVRDVSSSTGWKIDLAPFPGWKDVPTW